MIKHQSISIHQCICILLFFVCLFPLLSQADKASVTNTKLKLDALQIKIDSLQNTLAQAHDKRKTLDKELATTEKSMEESIHQLHLIQANMSTSQSKINQLKEQIQALNIQLNKAKQNLAEHVRSRYKIGEYKPFKWLMNQDNPQTMQRVFTYHAYVLKSRQAAIHKMNIIKAELCAKEAALNQEIAAKQILQHDLSQSQLALQQEKQYHKALISALQKDIQNKQQTLQEYKQNQANLSRLLTTLIQEQNRRPISFPVFKLSDKFAMPVHVNKTSMEKMNQGVVLFSNEGAPVVAARSGKVVFNDWLKGYGLLLIIDHGHGLMTLYAHNQSLFKKKGDMVVQGEKIASVGHSGTIKQNGLYFEIRRRGRAVPPMAWMS